MRAITLNKTKFEGDTNLKRVIGKVKYFLQKLEKFELFDVDAVMKSKDWPYLWRK